MSMIGVDGSCQWVLGARRGTSRGPQFLTGLATPVTVDELAKCSRLIGPKRSHSIAPKGRDQTVNGA